MSFKSDSGQGMKSGIKLANISEHLVFQSMIYCTKFLVIGNGIYSSIASDLPHILAFPFS